jgi:hypothetical protein
MAGAAPMCPPDGTPTPEVSVDDICDARLALDCSYLLTEERCRLEFEQFASPYEGTCCYPLFAAAFACGVEHGLTCSNWGYHRLPPACADLQEAYQVCLGSGDECQNINNAETGIYECDTYSASCNALGNPQPCVCGTGPHVNETFTFDGTEPFGELVARHCK